MTRPKQLGLIRHGATAWTSEGRYQGRADLPLSAEGFAELETLAEAVRSTGVTRLVTSPLLRARQSAEYLSQQAGLPTPQIDQNLIEIDYGDWEGFTQAEVKAKWPALLRQWKQAPETIRFPNGESLSDVRLRVRATLAAWPSGGADVAVLITHSVWIKLALMQSSAPPLLRDIKIPTGSLFWFSHEGIMPGFGFTNKELTSCV